MLPTIRDLEFDRCTIIVPDSSRTVNQSASVDESVNIQPTASTTPNLTSSSLVFSLVLSRNACVRIRDPCPFRAMLVRQDPRVLRQVSTQNLARSSFPASPASTTLAIPHMHFPGALDLPCSIHRNLHSRPM